MLTKRRSALPSDNLVKKCETLFKNNLSQYNCCVQLQAKLRMNLINHTTNEYKCLRSWLEKAREDYITMESNHGDLKDIYELLLKSDFVEKFYDYGETLDKLQLKFLKVMLQCKNLKMSLNSVENLIKSLKLEYKKSSATEEHFNYAMKQKTPQLKAINVMYQCKHLNTCLEEACDKIIKLNSEYDNLIECYGALLQNIIVKEFLDSANKQEQLQMVLAKKSSEGECSNLSQINTEIASLKKLCITERRRREEIEKAYSSLNEFSDKICRMLLHHQRLILPGEKSESILRNIESIQHSSKKELKRCDTFATAEFSTPTNLRTNISEQMNLDNDSQVGDKFSQHTIYTLEDVNEENTDISLESGITGVGNSTELDTSIREENVSDFGCNVCNGTFASQQILHDHKRTAHEGHKPYNCFVCGKLFTYRSNMKKHLTQFHRRVYMQTASTKKLIHKCTKCPMRFRNYRHKTLHLSEVHKS